MSVQPFAMVQKAVRALIQDLYAPAVGKTGSVPSFDPDTVDLFVELNLIGGVTDQVDGLWTLDIDLYGRDHNATMGHALALEAKLIGPRHVTSTMRIDNVYQNQAPAERPWDDEGVYRIGATYVFTARRPSSA